MTVTAVLPMPLPTLLPGYKVRIPHACRPYDTQKNPLAPFSVRKDGVTMQGDRRKRGTIRHGWLPAPAFE